MDEERRKFLEEALREMSDSDPVKHLVEKLAILQSCGESEQDVNIKEAALEDIQEICEDIDLASDFHKIGGFQLLPRYLHSEQEGFRWRTADLIATLVQNNPYCQEKALEFNLLPLLLNVIDTDSSSEVRTKALYALSCLTRDVEAAQEVFVKHDGFSVLIRAMQGDVDKLQVKAAFMLNSMCVSQPKYKDTLCELGMVEQLASLLQLEHNSSHEHLMGALASLARDHQRVMAECRRPELGLRELLQQRMDFLKGKEEYLEEYQHCEELQKLCFKTSTSSVDR